MVEGVLAEERPGAWMEGAAVQMVRPAAPEGELPAKASSGARNEAPAAREVAEVAGVVVGAAVVAASEEASWEEAAVKASRAASAALRAHPMAPVAEVQVVVVLEVAGMEVAGTVMVASAEVA